MAIRVGSSGNRGTFKAKCQGQNCNSAYQDATYRGDRVFNRCNNGGRCTVCGWTRADTGVK